MANAICAQCGAALPEGAALCTTCGTPVATAVAGVGQPPPYAQPPATQPPYAQPPATQPPYAQPPTSQPPGSAPAGAPYATPTPAGSNATGLPSIAWRSGVEVAGAPAELVAVVALLGLPALWFVVTLLKDLSDLPDYFDISTSAGFVAMFVFLLRLSVAAGLLFSAYLLYRRSRVGRGLTFVMVGVLFGIVVLLDRLVASIAGGRAGYVVAFLCLIVAAAGLLLLPALTEYLDRAAAGDPVSVRVARYCLLAWPVVFGLTALINIIEKLKLHGKGRYLFVGILLALVAAGGVVLMLRLIAPDKNTRILITAVAGAGALFGFFELLNGAFVVGLALAVIVALWVPNDARAWYGEKPLMQTRPSP